MAKTVLLESKYMHPLSEAEIIRAVQAKKKGVFRKIEWYSDIVHIGSASDEVVVTKTMFVRMNINYKNIKKVKDRLEAEDKAAGGTKDRRDTSYMHHKDDPSFVVRDVSTEKKKFLQLFSANAKDIRTKSSRHTELNYYKNGIKLDPTTNKTLIAVVEAKRRKIERTGEFDTFVLQFAHIVNII